MLFGLGKKPSPQEVAVRALCVGAVTARAELEGSIHGGGTEDAMHRCGELKGRINEWARGQGIWRQASQQETRLLDRPLGEWSIKEITSQTNRIEALVALLWALNRAQLGRHDQPCEREAVLARVPVLKDAKDFVNFSALRAPSEIESARNAATFWHWRSRAQVLLRNPQHAPHGQDLPRTIRMAAQTAYTKGYCSQPLDGDFPAFGKPYRELTDSEYSAVSTVSAERHYALNWLCGKAADWDLVPTDTEIPVRA
jgi:hypothetical protein